MNTEPTTIARRQTIFDKVFTHLKKQGEKSIMTDSHKAQNSCAYRGKNGTKCAIGILIPDDKYDPYMEGAPISESGVIHSIIGTHEDDHNFLQGLQDAHDRAEDDRFLSDIFLRMKKIAATYNLDASILTA